MHPAPADRPVTLRQLPFRLLLPILLVASLLPGCATTSTGGATTTPEVSAPATSEASGAGAQEMSLALRWVRTAAEHRALYLQVYRGATEEVEDLAPHLEPGTWAVALDADETVIDNSLYNKEREAGGLGYSSESWAEWVERREAPPLPGAVEFLGRVRELGGKIAIVTNRRDEHCPATGDNFHKYSIPFDVMLCKVDTGRKEPRWRSVEEGTASPTLPPLDIVLWLGDNIGDFPGGEQSWRDGPVEDFEGFGSRFFVLPNPVYGSWEDNPPR